GSCEGSARDVVAQCSANCPSANISLAADLAQGPSWNIQAA
ncbi:MAG: ferredoxin, partial [Polaromonas sp.]|nr:ferredoxin [Polaromonas sp.]